MYDIRPNKSRVYFLAHATVKTLSSFSNYLTAQYIKVNYNFFVDEILYFACNISLHMNPFHKLFIVLIHNMRQLKL